MSLAAITDTESNETIAGVMDAIGITSSETISIARQMYKRLITLGPKKAQPLMLYGRPGVGKTDTIIHLADVLANDFFAAQEGHEQDVSDMMSGMFVADSKAEYEKVISKLPESVKVVEYKAKHGKFNCVIISAPLLEPTDVKGIPALDYDKVLMRKVARWIKPYFLPESGAGIIFIDDLTAASPSVIASLLALVKDRRVQEYELPPGVMMIAAGNDVEDQSDCRRLSAAMRSRLSQFEFKPCIEDWIEWAYKNDIDSSIISFVREVGGSKYFIPQENELSERAFACPRSWERASNWMKIGLPPRLLREALIGDVGRAAANEFLTWRSLFEHLPSIDEIMKNPETAIVPEKLDARYFIATAVVEQAKYPKNFKSIITYAMRFPEEFQVIIMGEAIRLNYEIVFAGPQIGKDKFDHGQYMAKFTQKYRNVMLFHRENKL